MKNIGLILIFTLIAVVLTEEGLAQNTRSLKPEGNRKSVSLVASGKLRTYYWLDNETPSVITLRGPGKLRVLTRLRFSPGAKDDVDYTIKYRIDGGKEQTIKIKNADRSTKTTFQNGTLGVPGQLKDFTLNLSRGYHSIEFYTQQPNVNIATRYRFENTRARNMEWISYCPRKPSEPVDLISKESIVNYYRFSSNKPLIVEVNGPTQLRMLTRVENHFRMRGRVHYRVQVKENGGVINTFLLSSTRSDITAYKNEKDLVPGKGREFVINVPEGNHVYEIAPLDEDKNTILGRMLLPKKDVKLEK